MPGPSRSAGPRSPVQGPNLFVRLVVACGVLLLASASSVLAATYYVDGSNPLASDSGPGTSDLPFKTIRFAVSARGAAGAVILVQPATYREQVDVSASGSSSSPFVIEAAGPDVIVTGADDFSGTSRWSAVSGNVYRATSVSWTPLQVFADGVRLTPSAASTSSLPVNTFRYVSGSGLYVNVGGGNPGARAIEVGRRSHGFRVTGSYVTVDGFHVLHTEDHAIDVLSATASTIQDCAVSFANHLGIEVSSGNSVSLLRNSVSDNNDHGIYVSSSPNCRIVGNASFRNARPAVRAANGIYLNGSTGCTVEGNRFYDNQDSGAQFYNGANNCISRNNVSWNNGDHGFDHVRTGGVKHSNDVAYGNYKDGFSFEGSSPNASLFNCIAVDNGITTSEYNLWIDDTSMSGFQSNDNVIWNSTSQAPVKFNSTAYSSIASYASATGRDTRSIQSSPMFVNPAEGTFKLSAGSPAIDGGNAGATAWPALDATGAPRVDDPATVNRGLGTPAYADIGAHEYGRLTPDRAPVVIALTTATINEGSFLTMFVNARDPDDDPITSLTADFSNLPIGNHAEFVPNPDNTGGTLSWAPSFSVAAGSPYTVTFTAANAMSGSRSSSITVLNVDRAPVMLAPAAATAERGTTYALNVIAADPDGEAVTTFTANLSGLPAGNNAVFTTDATLTTGILTWTPQPADGPGPYPVRFNAGNALSVEKVTWVRVSRAPVVVAPLAIFGHEATTISVNVTASDRDGDAITALTADLSGLPAGHNATFSTNASKTSGTLTWTPTFFDSRAVPYSIRFTARSDLYQSATTAITVDNIDRNPVVTAPATVAALEGIRTSITITAADPDLEPLTSLTADVSGLPAGHNAVFTPNGSKSSGTLTWTPAYADAGGAPYVVRFRAANALANTAGTSITVRDLPAPGTELVANPGFESGTAGWSVVGSATLTRVSSGHSGGFAAQLATSSGSKSSFAITDDPASVGYVAAAGSTYRLQAWVRSSSSGGTIRLRVVETLAGSQQGSEAFSSGVTLSSSWKLVTFDYVTRAAGSELDLQIVNSPRKGRESFLVDDVSIKQLPNANIPIEAAAASREPATGLDVRSNGTFSARAVDLGAGYLELWFSTLTDGDVRIDVFDIGGRRVGRPLHAFMTAGEHRAALVGAEAGAKPGGGTYFYRLTALDGIRTGRFAIVR